MHIHTHNTLTLALGYQEKRQTGECTELKEGHNHAQTHNQPKTQTGMWHQEKRQTSEFNEI